MGELSALAGSEGYESCGDDVADPWYTDDFETTWRDVLLFCSVTSSFIISDSVLSLSDCT